MNNPTTKDRWDSRLKTILISETQNHHPDIEIKYNKVKLSITDHEKGEVSDKCYKLVKAIDKL